MSYFQPTDDKTVFLISSFTVKRNEEKYYHICDLENTVLATKQQQKGLFIVVLQSCPPRVVNKLPSSNDLTAVPGSRVKLF